MFPLALLLLGAYYRFYASKVREMLQIGGLTSTQGASLRTESSGPGSKLSSALACALSQRKCLPAVHVSLRLLPCPGATGGWRPRGVGSSLAGTRHPCHPLLAPRCTDLAHLLHPRLWAPPHACPAVGAHLPSGSHGHPLSPRARLRLKPSTPSLPCTSPYSLRGGSWQPWFLTLLLTAGGNVYALRLHPEPRRLHRRGGKGLLSSPCPHTHNVISTPCCSLPDGPLP